MSDPAAYLTHDTHAREEAPGPRAFSEPDGHLAGARGPTFDLVLKLGLRRAAEAPALRAARGAAVERRTLARLADDIARMAGLLTQMGARPGQHLAILAPMGPEAAVALLAGLRAGLVPFLLPAGSDQAALTGLLEASGAEIAIGIDRIAEIAPLDLLRNAAARTFGLRCIAGFGTSIPDGVVPLDHYLAGDACPRLENRAGQEPGRIATVDVAQDQLRSPHLGEAAVLEAGLRVVQALQIASDARILSAQLGADLPALATGLAAALLSGAEFMPLGPFSLTGLEAGLDGERATHLIVPAATATAVLKAGLAHHPAIATLVFLHQPGQPAQELVLPGDVAVPVVDIFNPVPHDIAIAVRPAAGGPSG